IYVAVEDDFGYGAAVGAASRLEDGRIEVDGWLCEDWQSAINAASSLGLTRQVHELYIGASVWKRCPPDLTPAPLPIGNRETPAALALLRDLVSTGQIVHDEGTEELDAAIAAARVREREAGQLHLTNAGP